MNHTWSILGAGAIGSLLASQFHNSDIPVDIILKTPASPTSKKINIIHRGDTQSIDLPIYVPGNTIHQLIITTKSYQTQEAIEPITAHMADDAVIVVLQNGMGSSDWFTERFPNATILAGTTTHGAFRQDSETIVHAGIGSTWMGPLKSADESVAFSIVEHWKHRGFPIEWDKDIEQRLWLKLAINCAINPLTVIYDCKNGELLSKSTAKNKMKTIISEFIQVYEARFCEQLNTDVLEVVFDVCSKTADNSSSMRQDVLNHRKTEIEAINGYLLSQAEALGIDCKQNRWAYEKVLEISTF